MLTQLAQDRIAAECHREAEEHRCLFASMSQADLIETAIELLADASRLRHELDAATGAVR